MKQAEEAYAKIENNRFVDNVLTHPFIMIVEGSKRKLQFFCFKGEQNGIAINRRAHNKMPQTKGCMIVASKGGTSWLQTKNYSNIHL